MSLAIIMLAGGGYTLITAFSPFFRAQLINPTRNETTRLLAATPETKITEDRLYIPKIDINVPL